MVCEKIKGHGDVQSEPHNQRVALVAMDGELPEIVRHKQGNDKNDNVGVRRKDRLDFFAREHGREVRFAFWHTGLRREDRNRGRGT